MFVDAATLVAFVLLAFGAFVVINALFGGGGSTATMTPDGAATLMATTPRKAGPIKRAFAGAIWQSPKEKAEIKADLLRAGYYRPTALEDYLSVRNVGVWLILALFVGLAFLVVQSQRRELVPMLLIAGVIIAALTYGLPRLMLGRQARNRLTRIERGLPDALDMIQMCLTGGLSLRASMDRVAGEIRHSHPDIAIELDIIRRQADAGTIGQALRNFADRIDAPDVKALSMTVTQSERLGTDVAVAISEFADQMRLTYRQRAEERASKTSVLILFPVIFCLIPPVLIAIAGPPMINLRNFLVEENRPGGILNPNLDELNQAPPDLNQAGPPGQPTQVSQP